MTGIHHLQRPLYLYRVHRNTISRGTRLRQIEHSRDAVARALKRLARYDALVIDDIGYVQQDREEMEVLFSLLAARYERGSVMITSNLPFSRWEQIFKDPMTTAAAIDRLVHHSVILELNLPSYRLEASRRQSRPETEARAE